MQGGGTHAVRCRLRMRCRSQLNTKERGGEGRKGRPGTQGVLGRNVRERPPPPHHAVVVLNGQQGGPQSIHTCCIVKEGGAGRVVRGQAARGGRGVPLGRRTHVRSKRRSGGLHKRPVEGGDGKEAEDGTCGWQ